jgi:DNA-binding winged helix-turn-helix (wHTH) protein
MIHRFGEFELDELERSLRRSGREIHLEPKVFDLLVVLVRHPGHVLSRTLLMRSLWHDVHVGESSLNRLVKEARRALGDDSRRPERIRTVRGTGYAFEGSVRRTTGDASRSAAPEIDLLHDAQHALVAAIDRGVADLRHEVDEFVRACRIAIVSAGRMR